MTKYNDQTQLPGAAEEKASLRSRPADATSLDGEVVKTLVEWADSAGKTGEAVVDAKREARAGYNVAAIGERLREIRAAAGLTQSQVAAMLGLSQARISQLENGDGDSASGLSIAVAIDFADACGFDLELRFAPRLGVSAPGKPIQPLAEESANDRRPAEQVVEVVRSHRASTNVIFISSADLNSIRNTLFDGRDNACLLRWKVSEERHGSSPYICLGYEDDADVCQSPSKSMIVFAVNNQGVAYRTGTQGLDGHGSRYSINGHIVATRSFGPSLDGRDIWRVSNQDSPAIFNCYRRQRD